jgi:N-acetylmuramoyl-L-alanine amidase
MEPYVIRQGDTLSGLAYRFGFDARTVWDHAKNADLRKRRGDPNILWPTDVLYIPTKRPQFKTVITGAVNTYVCQAPPTMTLRIKFLGAKFASQPCTVAELDQPTGLATDSAGVLAFAVPVTLEVATITVTALAFTCTCRIGHLDPIDTLSGISQRLQNLGLIHDSLPPSAASLGIVRGALRTFDASGAAGQDDTASPYQGLSDEGVLDQATSKRLLGAHGC